MRYVHLPANAVDVALLEDATRRGTLIALFPLTQQTPQATISSESVDSESLANEFGL